MASDADFWFIRLPDGRVLRARNTEALRRYLKSGGIPWESRVRRSAEAPWQTLDESQEFADLVPAESRPAPPAPGSAPGARSKATAGPALRTLGMRGLVDELFNAVDSCLQETKLIAAAAAGLGIGIVLILGEVTMPLVPPGWAWLAYVGRALATLLLFSLCTSILTQMTALELSRFRPAHFNEIRAGLPGYTLKIFGSLALVSGSLVAVALLLRWLPHGLTPPEGSEPDLWVDPALNVINGIRFVFEAICWPIFGLALLLIGPTLIVEDYSIIQGVREWLGMLRQHLGRIYLYQAIAFIFATAMALPLLAPVLLAFGLAPQRLSLGESVTFYVLVGLALTPMLSYLLVAHVFVYLNLRYEFFYSAREK